MDKTFAAFTTPTLEVYPSPSSHYRQRCEFRISHEDDDLFYAMFEVDSDNPKNKRVVRLDQFPVASEHINALMPRLREAFLASDELRRRLFQVEILTTLSGEALVTLIYHRPLGEAWEAEARALEEALEHHDYWPFSQQRLVLTRDHVWERLTVDGRELVYQQVETVLLSQMRISARPCLAGPERPPLGDKMKTWWSFTVVTVTLPLR